MRDDDRPRRDTDRPARGAGRPPAGDAQRAAPRSSRPDQRDRTQPPAGGTGFRSTGRPSGSSARPASGTGRGPERSGGPRGASQGGGAPGRSGTGSGGGRGDAPRVAGQRGAAPRAGSWGGARDGDGPTTSRRTAGPVGRGAGSDRGAGPRQPTGRGVPQRRTDYPDAGGDARGARPSTGGGPSARRPYRDDASSGRGGARGATGAPGRGPSRSGAPSGRGAGGSAGRGFGQSEAPRTGPARPWERDRAAGTSGTAVRRPSRRDEPSVPDGITGSELDRDVRSDLTTLAKDTAVVVARHLVAAGRVLDTDPERAYAHAAAAAARAGRIGSVREAAGLAAYAAGRYEDALRELRTARRLTGSDVHLPVLADCERGLGRPERALDLAATPEAARLDVASRIEMRIVAAGARMDLGEAEAAVVSLQGPELTSRGREPWRARLFSAYADALEAAGRSDESMTWLERAAAADTTGDTGAAERLREATGGADEDVVVFDLLDEDDEDEDEDEDDEDEDDEDDEEQDDDGGGDEPVAPAGSTAPDADRRG